VPGLAEALVSSSARRMVIVNLEPQLGETSGFEPKSYLEVLQRHAPGLRLDVVLADKSSVSDLAELEAVADQFGAEVVLADVRSETGIAHHDPDALARALQAIVSAPHLPPLRTE
jgi:2-phospho-L-lactate transferase/gluconeogenesis factor (CofD/UPF0052 family)